MVYNKENNLLKTKNNAKMKMSFDGNYKLISINDGLKDVQNLGQNPVITNSNTSTIYLYGTYYEVSTNGNVKKIKGQTKADKLNTTKLYKINDRKYLIIGKKIFSDDGSINTKDYLIIEIDKKGNATLYNNDINVKEINPMVIKTESFDLNIAKEQMIINNDNINLKKIIGSSNQYKEKTKKDEKVDNSLSNETINNTTDFLLNKNKVLEKQIKNQNDYYSSYFKTVKTTFNNLNNSLKSTNKQSYDIIEDNKKTKASIKDYDLTKWISIGIVEANVTSIKINYNIFDPNNEYKTTYLDITGTNLNEHIILNKEKGSTTIRNLSPNTNYKISLGYATSSDEGDINNTADIVNVKTLSPNYILKITKVTGKGIYYYIKADKEYQIDSGKINLYSDNELIGSKDLNTKKAVDGYEDFIETKKLGQEIVLRLESNSLNLDIYSKFMNVE